MGRHIRGAPAQYSHGGQSGFAKSRRVDAHHASSGVTHEDRVLKLLRNTPERVRELYPRISWAEVLDKLDIFNIEPTKSANIKPVDIEEMVLPIALQHHAALALYDCRAPTVSVQSAVELAWNTHSTFFVALAGDETTAILRYCQFKPPADLGPVFPVWRGTRGVDIEVARAGRSWTTRRDVAVAWAESLGEREKGRLSGEPLILRREVKASDVIYYSDQHGMAELVLDAEPAGEVDGERGEWRETAMRFAKAKLYDEAWKSALERVQGGGGGGW